jgi:hypothetical protein
MLSLSLQDDVDILLSDISTEDIRKRIPKELQIEYLSDAHVESGGNIFGIVYGPHYRLFCSTTVRYKSKIKIVPFLVDTGSRMTYLSAKVLNAFGLEFANPDTAVEVQINGRRTTVMMSKPHFKDVCLIGMEFMIVSNADLCVSSSNRTFTLHFYNW